MRVPLGEGISEQSYGRGLEGLVVGETEISRIQGEVGELFYRERSVLDLVEEFTFEEVVYLLLYDRFPEGDSEDEWRVRLASCRELPDSVEKILVLLAGRVSFFCAYQTAWAAACGFVVKDADDFSDSVVRILSWSATIAGRLHRLRQGKEPVEIRTDLGFAAHFLHQALGGCPEDPVVQAFDASLVVQAEHGIHAAALAALAVASARVNLGGAVLAGIGALRGPLHGGANRDAFVLIRDLKTPEAARNWTRKALEEKVRFPGFGHRVYKAPDPRVQALESMTRSLLEDRGMGLLWETFSALREEVEGSLGSRGIFANIDSITGLLYHAIGLEEEAFTVPFCLAIQAGWMAHIAEYLPEGPVFQPRSVYIIKEESSSSSDPDSNSESS